MNEYKKILSIFLLTILAIPIISLIIFYLKGGYKPKNGLTLMEVASSVTEINYDNEIITLTGNEREEFIKILKKINESEEIDDKLYEDIEFDILIDFKNDHNSKISTSKKIIVYDDGLWGYAITQKDLGKLIEIINRNKK